MIVTDDILINPKFLTAIIAGVILALGFQLILMAISVVMGITAIDDVKQQYAEAQANPSGNDYNDNNEFDQDHSSGMNLGLKITSAFGLWSVITTSIALFGATALVLNLNVLELASANITMALVIWALFYLLLFYLEARIINTVLGGLIQTATSGLRASTDAVQSMFVTSEESKVQNMVENTVDTIRQEFNEMDTTKISEVLDSSKIWTRTPSLIFFPKIPVLRKPISKVMRNR